MNLRNSSNSAQSRAKVLLLHPEDRYPPLPSTDHWDLIVDFGHAAPATHLEWSRRAHCPVLNVFDFCEDIQDLYRTRELLQCGMGAVVDRCAIDWWDVLSVMILPALVQLPRVRRVAAQVEPRSELYMSRPLTGAQALAAIVGSPLRNLENRPRAMRRRMQRYWSVVSRFDPAVTLQILQDKFDPQHSVRRRLAKRRRAPREPIVLLPSAYANVSRTEASYAALLPDENFLLVYARGIAAVEPLPPNVHTASLDAFFGKPDQDEIASLQRCWSVLREALSSESEEFATADVAGILDPIAALLPWGIAIRNAWTRFFDEQNVVACLSADDGNPYTRLPLMLAKKRGIPALACHHGALDYSMAMKTNHADFYLAKTEMEHDYLVNVCQVAPVGIVDLSPAISPPATFEQRASPEGKRWLVFFTEYSTSPWRGDEIYRDLMPALAKLARASGLKLIFKIHPFENKKDYQLWVKRYLPGEDQSKVEVLTGPLSPAWWGKIRFALAVQSSVALECRTRGIPVFLLGWLREPNCGYLEQLARFGIGQVLESPVRLAEIPGLVHAGPPEIPAISSGRTSPATLHGLLHGAFTSLASTSAQSVEG